MEDYAWVRNQDEEVYAALIGEERRQAEGLELIPSENYVSRAVREANASVFTNKYAEGYPGKRYYGGQEYTDAVERIAIERAKELFSASFANVQPHSGSNANTALYFAILDPGDTVLAMNLSHGGHLTHGHPVTYLTKLFRFVHYGVDQETGLLDYEEMERLAHEERPKIILTGYSSYTRSIDYQRVVAIAREVGALAVMDIAHIAGLIAGGALENPFDAGFDILTSTTHKTLRGPRGGLILVREVRELAKKIDRAVFPGFQGGPLMHHIAAKAVAFGEALHPSFRGYAQQVLRNAKAMEEVFKSEGVELVHGGTDNHMLLVDVHTHFGLHGGEAEEVLDTIGITLNKNVIPDDPLPPMRPSGIRFGTPAITSRGFEEGEARRVARIMIQALRNPREKELLGELREEVRKLSFEFPIPESYLPEGE